MGSPPVNGRGLPAVLVLICLIPTVFGSLFIADVLLHGPYTFVFAPDTADRLSLAIHALSGIGFLTLGAIQLLPGTRTRHRKFHRRLGKVAAVSGLIGAISGLWLTLAHPLLSSPLLFWGRIGASLFWVLAIALALRALQRRDFGRHGAWMLRAYAIAMPAGTLAYIMLPIFLIIGEEGHEILFEAIQVAAWPLHVLLIEALIRHKTPLSLSVKRT